MRGFWNDSDGLGLADVVVLAILPVWMYTAIKLALAKELSGNQVDFFLTLSYPLLLAIGGRAISSLPWPGRRIRPPDVEEGGLPYADSGNKPSI